MNAANQRYGEIKKLELEIQSDLDAIQTLLEQIQQLFPDKQTDSPPPYGNQLAIALCLHHIYTASEQIFIRISKTIDQFTYSGDGWHKEVLKNMTLEVPNARSAAISKHLYREFDNLRAFRHIVRHAYDYELDWNRLFPLCISIDEIVQEFQGEMKFFLTFTSRLKQNLVED